MHGPHRPVASDGVEVRGRHQMTLKLAMLAITAICVFFAIPGGTSVFTTLGGWVLVGGLVIGFLMVVQYPVYLLLARGTARWTESKSSETVTPQNLSREVRNGREDV